MPSYRKNVIAALRKVTANWDRELKDEYEIARYMVSLNPDVDEDWVTEYFRNSKGVLKEVDVSSLKQGPSDSNIPDHAKEKEYKKMPVNTMPPLIVEDGIVSDGNHRLRVLKELKVAKVWVYDIMDN